MSGFPFDNDEDEYNWMWPNKGDKSDDDSRRFGPLYGTSIDKIAGEKDAEILKLKKQLKHIVESKLFRKVNGEFIWILKGSMAENEVEALSRIIGGTIICIPEGVDIEELSPEELEAIGLQRKSRQQSYEEMLLGK